MHPGAGWSRGSQILGAEINCYLGRGGAIIYYVLNCFWICKSQFSCVTRQWWKIFIEEISKNNKLIMCCSQKSIMLLSKITDISYFTLSSLYRLILMASESTPKKFYKKSSGSTKSSSRCRLCNSVQDQKHCKSLFKKTNEEILNKVELIYGEKLPHVDGFPYLICRPCECERRLNNAISIENVISETQKSLVKDSRSKRCPYVSPSVARPSSKVSTVESRRRSFMEHYSCQKGHSVCTGYYILKEWHYVISTWHYAISTWRYGIPMHT